MKKLERPFFDTIRWLLLGGFVGLLIFLAHALITHDPKQEIDDHASSSNGERQPRAGSVGLSTARLYSERRTSAP